MSFGTTKEEIVGVGVTLDQAMTQQFPKHFMHSFEFPET